MQSYAAHSFSFPPIPDTDFALFLDIDGTISPLAPLPDQAHIPQETLDRLHTLHAQLNGALALVSGRSIAAIDQMCAPYTFCVVGQHGLELRCGEKTVAPMHGESELIAGIRARITEFYAAHPQVYIEYKGLSIALHYRQAPWLARQVEGFLKEIALEHKDLLCVQDGKMVSEIRLQGADKGRGILSLMALPAFAGKTPVYAGDDLTDEDGFRAVNTLGGVSVKVGRGRSCATWYVSDTEEMHAWLEEISRYLNHRPAREEKGN